MNFTITNDYLAGVLNESKISDQYHFDK